jgi:spore photoproduct lyase
VEIKKLFVDAEIENHRETKHICGKIGIPAQITDDPLSIYRWINQSSDPVRLGKQVLYLTRNKGGFLKACPGTKAYTCCDYQILHVASFCVMDCSYCILQSYFHPPMLQFFVNREDLDAELTGFFHQGERKRVGTGEFTDSLIWERWTDLTEYLVTRFSKQEKAVLELKTKTVNIQKLKELDHRRKTILSWSMNTPAVIASEERNTAPLHSRLKAAEQCQKWGYPLSFHFDPMMIYQGCEEEYRKVVQMIFETIDPENIVWISLGTFRFMPSLKPIVANRFPSSKIIYGEFITGLDNKMRYFKPLRIELYKKMVKWIRDIAPDVTVYFCMEDDEVWKTATGFVPEPEGGLCRMLDKSAAKICGLVESS